MLMKTKSILSYLTLLISTMAFGTVKSKTVVYESGNRVFEGMLVYPENVVGNAPGILMVHSWMGVTSETQRQAERMANLGFIVFAADIYGKDFRPKNTQEAGTVSGQYRNDRKLFRERVTLGLDMLKRQENVDNERIFAVGYCFGGTGVLELARTGVAIDGIISFHGGLDSPAPEDGANINSKILVLHGADDPFVSAEDLTAFENELRTHKVDWQLIKYGGAVHSFTDVSAGSDPSTGAAYNHSADMRSFEAFKAFVQEPERTSINTAQKADQWTD